MNYYLQFAVKPFLITSNLNLQFSLDLANTVFLLTGIYAMSIFFAHILNIIVNRWLLFDLYLV